MSDFPQQERHPITPSAKDDEAAGGVTRRTVLAGAAAATAAATVAAVDKPARAQSVDANTREDMVSFVLLSAALTGVAENKLAPAFNAIPAPPAPIDLQKSVPGSDPVDIKREYFNWVNERNPAAFESLLKIVKGSSNLSPPERAQAILDKSQANEDTKFLARSIILMWYLGAWYDPDILRSNPSPFASTVISPKAYTQSWALRVAQAHPMGFSEMQFGYWTHESNDLADFIGRKIT